MRSCNQPVLINKGKVSRSRKLLIQLRIKPDTIQHLVSIKVTIPGTSSKKENYFSLVSNYCLGVRECQTVSIKLT